MEYKCQWYIEFRSRQMSQISGSSMALWSVHRTLDPDLELGIELELDYAASVLCFCGAKAL